MIQPERQVLTVHTVIYTCVITYTIIKMYLYAAYLLWYHSAIELLIRYESTQFAACSERSPFVANWDLSQAYQILNLHCISIFAYDVGTSNEAGLDETPALADHNKRLLSQQELAWTQLGSRSHSQQEMLSMICLALFQSPAKKRVIVSDGSEGLGHFERAGLSEYLERPLYPFLWHQSLWPNNRLKRWNTAEGSRILDDLCHRYVKK